jgi:hypothetical protein
MSSENPLSQGSAASISGRYRPDLGPIHRCSAHVAATSGTTPSSVAGKQSRNYGNRAELKAANKYGGTKIGAAGGPVDIRGKDFATQMKTHRRPVPSEWRKVFAAMGQENRCRRLLLRFVQGPGVAPADFFVFPRRSFRWFDEFLDWFGRDENLVRRRSVRRRVGAEDREALSAREAPDPDRDCRAAACQHRHASPVASPRRLPGHASRTPHGARRSCAVARMARFQDMRREWASGSIYQHGDRWRVSVSLGSDAFGKRIRKEWQVRSEASAKRKLREVQARLRGGLPAEESRITVSAYAHEWLVGVKPTVKPSTYSFYRTLSEIHLDEIAHLPLAHLSPQDIRRLIAKRLDEGYSTRTVRGILDVLRMILKQAVNDGILTRNVAELVTPPKLEQAAPIHFTVEQARRFLEVAKDDELGALYAVAHRDGSSTWRTSWPHMA